MANIRVKQTNLALDAARQVIADPTLTTTEVSEKTNVTRHSILSARVLLEYGTQAELDAVVAGKLGLSVVYDTIKERLSPEVREAIKKRHGRNSIKAREKYSGEASIWANLGPALRALSEMPNVQDVLPMLAHTGRVRTVNKHLEAASQWMEEFNRAWNGQQTRSAVSENSANAGNGNAVSGTQQPKSAT